MLALNLDNKIYKEIIYRSKMELKKERRCIEGNELEKCVSCGNETNVKVKTRVDMREYYVEGAGQLCVGCYTKIYP